MPRRAREGGGLTRRRPSADGSLARDGAAPRSRPHAHPGAPRPRRQGRGVDCPHFPRCPGCPLVGEPYLSQLARKRARIVDALRAAGVVLDAVAIAPVEPAPAQTGYRAQAKLVASAGPRGVVLGLYHPGSHHVLDVSGCPLHDPLIRAALAALRDVIAAASVPIHARDRRGLRYVLLRASASERRLLVTLVSSAVPLAGAPAVARHLRRAVPLAGLVVNENRTPGNVILGARTFRVWGEAMLRERYGPVVLAAGSTAFVQANPVMAARIYGAIAAAANLRGTERVLDLYCGVGGIALTVAPAAAEVVGVEEVVEAVRAARQNARRNRRANARFEAGLVVDALPTFAPGTIDVVTMNPPRRGCGTAVARALGALGAARVLYLSCAPESFARDAAELAANGYALRRVQPFDLLPHTDHVELLGTFLRSARQAEP